MDLKLFFVALENRNLDRPPIRAREKPPERGPRWEAFTSPENF